MLDTRSVTISASGTVSTAVAANGQLIEGVFIPSGMTGTSITFLAAPSNGAPTSRISDGVGGAYTKTFVAGDYVPLDPAVFGGVAFLQVVSGSTESAARTLVFSVRGFP